MHGIKGVHHDPIRQQVDHHHNDKLGISAAIDISLGKWFGHWRNRVKSDALLKHNLRLIQATSGITNASGNLDLTVFQNRTGRRYIITRVIIWADTFTPGNTFQSATAWFGFYGGNSQTGVVKDYWPQVTPASTNTILPFRITYGTANALRFVAEEDFTLFLVSGPATKNITCEVNGYFDEISDDYIV